jgi:hypothetical protein
MPDRPIKPVYGAPCNGCGLCCIVEQCPISVDLFGQRPRCPALIDEGGPYSCGLISRPRDYFVDELASYCRDRIAIILGAGEGCDSVANEADQAASDALPPGEEDRIVARVRSRLAALDAGRVA